MKVAVALHAQRTVPQAALARCEFSKPKRCWRAEAACRHTGDRSPAPRGSNRNWCIADAKARSCILDKERSRLRGLTFELSGRQRQDARPGLAKMYRVPPDRAWWPAVGAPLERGVRPHRGDDAMFQVRAMTHRPFRHTTRMSQSDRGLVLSLPFRKSRPCCVLCRIGHRDHWDHSLFQALVYGGSLRHLRV